MAENRSRIIVHRVKTPGWQDRWRAYEVQIDGVGRGKVRRGQSVSCDVFPGAHLVQVRIDWAGSPEIKVEVAPGATVELEVSGIGGAVKASRAAVSADAKHTYLDLKICGASD